MNSAKLQYKKINTQKSLTFLDTNNERAEKETKEAMSFTIASKRISLLEINLPMEEKDLCWGPAPADPGYSKERRPRRLFIC